VRILCSTLLLLGVAISPGVCPGQSALQMPPESAAPAPPAPPLPHPTLDRIHQSSQMMCGVSREEEDFSRNTDHGNRAAFDIDLCKAVAVAVLGPGAHLVIRNFPDEPATLRALRAGEVDMVATASLSVRNMANDVAFSAPVLLDGQSVLFANNPAVHTAADLAGKRVCFLTGSAAEEGLHSYAAEHGVTFVWYPFSEAGEMEAAFFTGNCDAVTGDLTSLANIRAIEPRRAHEFTLLPQTIRPDPMAVATWAGDARFAAVAFWTVQALLAAEQRGITQASVDTLGAAQEGTFQAFLGHRFGTGAALGLRDHWAAEVIRAGGNYGEIFERDLGPKSPLGMDRGENRLTTQGGSLVAEPLTDR
jgi:general L-amino acid transport system substrate-binding protein